MFSRDKKIHYLSPRKNYPHRPLNGVQQKRIIVFENNDDLGCVLHDRLEALGYAVLMASNFDEAMAYLDLFTLDGILFGLHVPKVESLQMLEQVHQRHKHIPIIVMSTELDKEILAKAIEHGATDYLINPIDVELLAKKCMLVFE